MGIPDNHQDTDGRNAICPNFTYGNKAVVLEEEGVSTYRVQHFDPGSKDEKLRE